MLQIPNKIAEVIAAKVFSENNGWVTSVDGEGKSSSLIITDKAFVVIGHDDKPPRVLIITTLMQRAISQALANCYIYQLGDPDYRVRIEAPDYILWFGRENNKPWVSIIADNAPAIKYYLKQID